MLDEGGYVDGRRRWFITVLWCLGHEFHHSVMIWSVCFLSNLKCERDIKGNPFLSTCARAEKGGEKKISKDIVPG